MSVRLAPSILSADFAFLARDIAAAEDGGADLLHVDVMDGHFVPNLTLGPPVIRAVKRVARVPLDVHLMIANPDPYLKAYVDAGASMLSVHAEVLPHLHRTVAAIKELGAKAGVVLNPSTPVSVLENVAADVDFVLVMSVNPGFGGQRFIPRALDKIRAVRAMLDAAGTGAFVEVDGGVDLTTIGPVVEAGATVIVDYGHNVSALSAIVEAIEQFPHERRTVVYSAAGDRRDEDLLRQGEMLGEAFDRVILYEDHYIRGREEGDIMRLFREGLTKGARVSDVQEFKGNLKAIESVLREARAGDLLVIQADVVDEVMVFLNRFLATSGAGHEIDLTDAINGQADPSYLASQITD